MAKICPDSPSEPQLGPSDKSRLFRAACCALTLLERLRTRRSYEWLSRAEAGLIKIVCRFHGDSSDFHNARTPAIWALTKAIVRSNRPGRPLHKKYSGLLRDLLEDGARRHDASSTIQ